MSRLIALIAGLLGALAVGIGAFAAHGLDDYLAEHELDPNEIAERVDQCEVAVRYHLAHALALLALGLAGRVSPGGRLVAAILFTLGIALFSGGLYSMVFFGVTGHWAIVPSGGMCMILGWLATGALAFQPSQAGDG